MLKMFDDSDFSVPPPIIKDREFKVPLFLGTGPANYWPSVEKALNNPIITPMCDEFYNVLDDIRTGIQYIFQTESKLVLALSGAGHTGMEASISNLVAPGETLLICSRGMWDDRAYMIAQRYDIKTEILRIPITKTFTLDQIETELKRLRPAALYITYGDSSTGNVQNMIGLGNLCHKYGTLLIVDTVVSIGGIPFFMDKWSVDVAFTSTQKALSGPPGISAIAFSKLAENKINNRKHEPTFYFDIPLLALQWNCYGNTRKYHHTLTSPLLWALRECLKEISNETLPKIWSRHDAVARHFYKRLEGSRIKLLIEEPEERLATCTLLVLPDGIDHAEFVKYMKEKHNILIYVGVGPSLGYAIRTGLMGVNSTIEIADKLADALEDTLRALE